MFKELFNESTKTVKIAGPAKGKYIYKVFSAVLPNDVKRLESDLKKLKEDDIFEFVKKLDIGKKVKYGWAENQKEAIGVYRNALSFVFDDEWYKGENEPWGDYTALS